MTSRRQSDERRSGRCGDSEAGAHVHSQRPWPTTERARGRGAVFMQATNQRVIAERREILAREL